MARSLNQIGGAHKDRPPRCDQSETIALSTEPTREVATRESERSLTCTGLNHASYEFVAIFDARRRPCMARRKNQVPRMQHITAVLKPLKYIRLHGSPMLAFDLLM